MTRIKKSRKTGPVAPRSVPKAERKREQPAPKKPSKQKGLPAGSRFSVKAQTESPTMLGQQAKDPRHGSKKPVALIMPEPIVTKVKQPLEPAEELALLENDEQLQDFLAALDEGEILHADDQAWVNQQLARFQQLVEILGLDLDEDDDDEDERL